MKKPKMILFDYGQTLANEPKFDGVKGTEAVLRYAAGNPGGYTAQEIQEKAEEIDFELGRYDPARKHLFQIEVPNSMLNSYLYGMMGIEIPLSQPDFDRIFWDAAAPAVPTDGIEGFLVFLEEQGVRTGVISNISYCGEAVEERIGKILPGHRFECILPSSEYMFRKPNRRIFELALQKAGLPAEDVWYVGDSFQCDVIGAQQAGMVPVWYVGASKKPAEKQDVLTVYHWSELQNLISELK